MKAKKESDEALMFFAAPLRFFTREIAKNRQLAVLQLLCEGRNDVDELARITGSNVKSAETWKIDFLAGKRMPSITQMFGKKDFNSSDLSKVIGFASTKRFE